MRLGQQPTYTNRIFEQHVNRTLTRINSHTIRDGFVAVSGGKDSTVMAYLVYQAAQVNNEPMCPLAFYNSGLDLPETLPYLFELADTLDTVLHVFHPEHDMRTILHHTNLYHPNSSVGMHVDTGLDMYNELINKPALVAHRMLGNNAFVGVRSAESAPRKRMLDVFKDYRPNHPQTGFNTLYPIYDWNNQDIYMFLQSRNITPHPAYAIYDRLNIPKKYQRVGMLFDANGYYTLPRFTVLKQGWPHFYHDLIAEFPWLNNYR